MLLLCGVAQQVLHFAFEVFGGSFPGVGILDRLHGGSARVPADVADGAVTGTGPGPAGPGTMQTAELMLFTHAAASVLTLLAAAGVAKLERLRATTRHRSTSSR